MSDNAPEKPRDLVVFRNGNVLPPDLPPTPREKEARGYGITVEALDDAIAKYSHDQQEIVRFWFLLGKEKQWSLKEMERRTGVSSSSLTRVFRGIYGADVGNLITRLDRAKDSLIHAADNPDFIPTSLAKLMFTGFDKCRALRNVCIMWGKKGIGKTTIEKEYTRLNGSGRTFYVRCPGSGCTNYQFIRHVADSMHIAVTKTDMFSVRKEIVRYLSKGSRLLIIDELHEIFLTCSDKAIVQICEFLRELADDAECGLVLTGTDKLHHHFFEGIHRGVLEQLADRGTVQIDLPDTHTKQDVVAFLDHFGLELPDRESDAYAILDDIIRENGLRKLTHHLRDGKAYAAALQEDYTWNHFTKAFVAIRSLSKKRKPRP